MSSGSRYIIHFGGEGEPEGFIELPQGFEYPDVQDIARQLEQAAVFVPGYSPPSVGLYSPDGFIYQKYVERNQTVLFPDLNLVSDWVQLAKGESASRTRRVSAAILSFCQNLGIELEPSIACHELAHGNCNELAVEKLAWVRAADNAEFSQWRDIALGRRECLSTAMVPRSVGIGRADLAKPLRRWRRNYICALKAAELELADMSAIERVIRILRWMRDDFIVAGPASFFCFILFAPNSAPRKGLLKDVRSEDRVKALAGVRNAAWDLTYVSELVRQVNENVGSSKRFLFASHDHRLLRIASAILECSADAYKPDVLARTLGNWWPVNQATEIARQVGEMFELIDAPERKQRQASAQADIIEKLIHAGEANILGWLPRSASA